MDIIFDTNCLHNDYLLTGTDINKIVIKAKSKGYNLFIPEVVVQEMIKHFEKSVQGSYRLIEKGIKDYERATDENLTSPLTKKILDDRIKAYPKKLRKKIKDLGISILPIPHGQEHTLMLKAVNRKKPFTDSGVGFPDALIWATILEKAEEFSEVELIASPRIIFVTNNHTDFCNSDKFEIHLDLQEELENLSIPFETIKIIPTIDEISKLLFVSPNDIVKKDIERYLSTTSFRNSDLYSQLTKRILNYLPYKAFQPDDLGFIESYEDPSIDTLNEDYVFELDSVDLLSQTEVSINWNVSITCLFDFYVYKGDLSYFDEKTLSIYDWNWNDHYVAAQKEKNVWFTVEIIADEKLWKIKNFEIEINSERNRETRQIFQSSNL